GSDRARWSDSSAAKAAASCSPLEALTSGTTNNTLLIPVRQRHPLLECGDVLHRVPEQLYDEGCEVGLLVEQHPPAIAAVEDMANRAGFDPAESAGHEKGASRTGGAGQKSRCPECHSVKPSR